MLSKQILGCLWGIIFVTSSLQPVCTHAANAKKSKHHSSSCSNGNQNVKDAYDYVIVGAGNAGAALAAKLSNRTSKHGKYKNSVLVLEAGVNLTNDPEVLAATIFETFPLEFDPKYSKVTSSQLTPSIEFPYSEGRMWGGSSAHNNLQAVRGTPPLYDQWAAISGDARWSYNQLLKNVMIPMEHYTPDSTPPDFSQRGFNGPVFITQEPPLDNDRFMQAISIGTATPFSPDLNDPNYGNVGIGANQDWVTPPFAAPTSVRSFSANAYLTGEPSVGIPPIVDSEGNGLNGRKLKILSNAQVNRVLFSNNVAKSVEYILSTSKETVQTVKAKKKIILCSGTISDAAILQRSGIGDAALLNSLNIPVVFANSNVGANMYTHVGPQGLISNVSTTVTPPRLGSGFIDIPPSTGNRKLQLIVLDSLAFFPKGIADALQIDPSVTIDILCFNITPRSHGTVEIVSRDPFFDPRVNINIYSDGGPTDPGSDASKVVAFYNLLPGIAAAYGGGAVVTYPPAVDYLAGPDALFADALNTNVTTQHLSGTCRMAQSPADGVVDGQLQVFGVKNLMVASNSVAPVIEDGNTGYEAFVIGLEAARILRGH